MKGVKSAPTLAIREHRPMPEPLTEVGNSSEVKMKINPKAPEAAFFAM